MTFIFFWLAFCAIVAIAAHRRCNRDGAAWFFISLIFSPLIGGCLLLVLGPLSEEKQQQKQKKLDDFEAAHIQRNNERLAKIREQDKRLRAR